MDTCPWRTLPDPFVQFVVSVYRHWKQGILGSVFGGDDEVPKAVIDGLSCFDSALQAVFAQDRRDEKAARDADKRRIELEGLTKGRHSLPIKR